MWMNRMNQVYDSFNKFTLGIPCLFVVWCGIIYWIGCCNFVTLWIDVLFTYIFVGTFMMCASNS
jgi:hypothetical protein